MASKQRGLMTSGVIWKELLLFSIPLLLGNLFQLLYNTVDSIVVGNFVGHQALAAVGASTPLINMLIGFFMGVAAGAGSARGSWKSCILRCIRLWRLHFCSAC